MPQTGSVDWNIGRRSSADLTLRLPGGLRLMSPMCCTNQRMRRLVRNSEQKKATMIGRRFGKKTAKRQSKIWKSSSIESQRVAGSALCRKLEVDAYGKLHVPAKIKLQAQTAGVDPTLLV